MKNLLYTTLLASFLLLAGPQSASTQAIETGYRMPPPEVAAIVDAPPTPGVSLSPDRSLLLLSERPNLPAIADLAQPELRLAGIRINPATNGPSQPRFVTGLSLLDIATQQQFPVTGLPDEPRITSVSWSPDGTHIAFLHTSPDGVELWVADISRVDAARGGAAGQANGGNRGGSNADADAPAHADAGVHPDAEVPARRIGDFHVNDTFYGGSVQWNPDGTALLTRKVPRDRGAPPPPPAVPDGPVIQENLGRTAPARTYQDLLGDRHDEELFDYYFTSVPVSVTLDGQVLPLAGPGIYRGLQPSPDGNWVLLNRTLPPYSYTLPAFRFPTRIEVRDASGDPAWLVADLPLQDDIPIGFGAVPTGPRSVSWRNDASATLVWVEAQDGGDPRSDADVRDKVFLLDAPFTGTPVPLAGLGLRFRQALWSDDGLALISERWWSTRQDRIWRVAPGDPESEPVLVSEHSFEDRYNIPGSPVTTANEAGFPVLMRAGDTVDSDAIYLTGPGASPEGDRPFLDRFDLQTGETERLWQSEAPYFERVVDLLDTGADQIVTRREAPQDPPNFFVRDLTGRGHDHDEHLTQLTHFEHPNPNLRDVSREMITYEREDGVPLSGDLYLPPDYDPERDGRLPLIVWAYPREFRSADAAGQVSGSPYSFTSISYWRPQWLVTQGYAVLDNATMPVIGEDDAEPNDTFIAQLVMNGQAAVDAVAAMGIADPDRAAIGGHSYGAFMTANILAHSDIFRAGIARSGAYNRSLTPFGFQREERTIWDDTDLYIRMSPFFSADRIQTPILIIHGSEDNNSGTFPMQSERLFAALQGLGGTARLVMLPYEGHGYRARESVMHMLWETLEWLDTYVKPES